MVYFSLESNILFIVLIIENDLIIAYRKKYVPGDYFFVFFN